MQTTGFLIIDKPSGMTSHDVVDRVRRKLNIRKVGHLGTLDPLATGVLVMAIGQATKLVKYFIDDDKKYLTTVRLGTVTDSQDLDGKIISQNDDIDITREQLEQGLESFIGEIDQIPPMVSAKKVKGQRLYKLHRKGIEVERDPKKVTIKSIVLKEFDLPSAVFEVECSKGTYVRTLCSDLGEKLGTGGAMSALVRLRSGFFLLEDALELEQFEEMEEDRIVRKILSPALAIKRKNR
jgi:tRNA pseudouridine55 synthase